jgi:hypothetical protein
MPASGPVDEPKMFPARILEDQDMEMEPVTLGTPPFSSPDPMTDGIRMLPLEDGTSAVEGEVLPEQPLMLPVGAGIPLQEVQENVEPVKLNDLKTLAEDRGIAVARAEGEGAVRKEDYVQAVVQDEQQRAADLMQKIQSAKDEEELDQAKAEYDDHDFNYPSIDDAIERKEEQFSEQPADEEEEQQPTQETRPTYPEQQS